MMTDGLVADDIVHAQVRTSQSVPKSAYGVRVPRTGLKAKSSLPGVCALTLLGHDLTVPASFGDGGLPAGAYLDPAPAPWPEAWEFDAPTLEPRARPWVHHLWSRPAAIGVRFTTRAGLVVDRCGRWDCGGGGTCLHCRMGSAESIREAEHAPPNEHLHPAGRLCGARTGAVPCKA